MNAWSETPAALQFLAEIDAAERMSDGFSGIGWSGVTEALIGQWNEAESGLDTLRGDAINAIADATGAERWSEPWDAAHDEADEDLISVKDAIKQARRDRAGDSLIEWSAAA